MDTCAYMIWGVGSRGNVSCRVGVVPHWYWPILCVLWREERSESEWAIWGGDWFGLGVEMWCIIYHFFGDSGVGFGDEAGVACWVEGAWITQVGGYVMWLIGVFGTVKCIHLACDQVGGWTRTHLSYLLDILVWGTVRVCTVLYKKEPGIDFSELVVSIQVPRLKKWQRGEEFDVVFLLICLRCGVNLKWWGVPTLVPRYVTI